MRLRPPIASLLVPCCALLGGCGSAAPPRVSSELRVVAGRGRAVAPTVFHATVRGPSAGDEDRPVPAFEARVTLSLRDDGFEYDVRVSNPEARLVTGAWIGQGGRGDGPSTALVQLFSDARFRDRLIEVRGTAAVVASLRAAALAEELQSNPAAFQVTLTGGAPGERWSAPLMVGR